MDNIESVFSGPAGLAACVFFLITAYLDLSSRGTVLVLARGIAALVLGVVALFALLD